MNTFAFDPQKNISGFVQKEESNSFRENPLALGPVVAYTKSRGVSPELVEFLCKAQGLYESMTSPVICLL